MNGLSFVFLFLLPLAISIWLALGHRNSARAGSSQAIAGGSRNKNVFDWSNEGGV